MLNFNAIKQVDIKMLDSVYLKPMPCFEFLDLQKQFEETQGEDVDNRKLAELYVQITVGSLVDSDGNRPTDVEQVEAEIRQLPWPVLLELGLAALRVNLALQEDVQKK